MMDGISTALSKVSHDGLIPGNRAEGRRVMFSCCYFCFGAIAS